jgi:WD40 repeat protein
MNTKILLAAVLMAQLFTGRAMAQTTQPILRLNTTMHFGYIARISTDAQGRYMLSCSWDKTAKLWDAASGELIRNFRPPIDLGNVGMLYACSLSPDGKIAAVGGATKLSGLYFNIYIFNTANGGLIQGITGLETAILDLEFSMDGNYLAAAVASGNGVYIYKWSETLTKFQTFGTLDGYNGRVDNICFDQSGRLATVCDDGHLRLYDDNFNKINEIQISGGKLPFSVAFSPDASKIAVGYYDSPIIEVYDGFTLDPLFNPDTTDATGPYGGGTCGLSFSADGSYLFGGGINLLEKDSTWWFQLRRWENAGKGSYVDFDACNNRVMDIKPLPDSSIIFAGVSDIGRMRNDGSIVFYKSAEINFIVRNDESPLQINNDGNAIGFTPINKSKLYFSAKNRQLTDNLANFQNFKDHTDQRDSIRVNDWIDNHTPLINGIAFIFTEQYEISRCVDISPDETSAVLGTNWNIYCLNAQGERKWKTPVQGDAWEVNIAGDNRTLVAALSDGTIRWYRMSDGALLLTLFAHPDNKRWVLYTTNGFYICSEGGDELIGWHINDGADKAANFHPAKNYADHFYRPDIVSEILKSCETDLEILTRKGEEIADISKLPPLVKITSPENNFISSTSQITISVDVTGQDGGIDEVLLYLNGKLVETTQRGVKYLQQDYSSFTKTYNVTLSGGENRIKATAFNSSRTEAIADEINVTYQGAKETANLYLFIIGIDEYKNPSYKLNYAVADATSIKTEMEKGVKEIFGNVIINLMRDATVTRSSIMEKFDELKTEVKQEDVFIFYYAGHGVMSEDEHPQFYIVPFDVIQLVNTNSEMQKMAISASELQTFSKDLKAQKQLFVFDACQSGGLVDMLATRGALEERAIAQLARSTGTYWIAASGSQQFATEFTTLGHGLFTYTILQGFQGDADGNNDKKITVEELSTYVKNKLPEFSEKYKGEAQYPNSFGYGMDFPIFILK